MATASPSRRRWEGSTRLRVRAEMRRVTRLALPVMAAQVGVMLMGTVDTLMVGRVGVDALAAAAVANAWVYGCLLFGQGLIQGIDPIVTRAHGAGDGALAGRTLQRGIVLALLASVPLALLWLKTGAILRALGQDPQLAALAHDYVWIQIPSIPCFLVYVALRQYLQGRELMRPAMWVIAIANVFNALFNWVLIFGKLGFPALGLYGAGIATSSTRALVLGLLLLWVWVFSLHRGAWLPWSRDALRPAALRAVLGVGLPVALQVSLEIWAFSAATLLAGRLGATAAAAHTIALNMAALAFMMPLGISQGAVTRVGNLLGASRPRAAQIAAWVATGLGASVMTLSAIAFVSLRDWLPTLYTPDAGVVLLCASILPIAAAFQIFDGTQVVGCGVLRGMGRTRPAAWFNLLGYWILGLPVGAFLAFERGWGLAGIWWGMCLGLAVVAGALVLWLRVRGPASLRSPAEIGEREVLSSGRDD